VVKIDSWEMMLEYNVW